MKDRDIVISWPNGAAELQKLIRWGYISIKSFPSQFDLKYSRIGIVQNGNIVLVANVKRIELGIQTVIASGSNKPIYKNVKANRLYFKTTTIKKINVPCTKAGFYAFGAWGYYNLNKNQSVVISDYKRKQGGDYIDQRKMVSTNKFRSRPYIPGVSGGTFSQPERALINAYIEYCNLAKYVVQPYIKSDKIYADLLDVSKYRLIEAKASTDRKAIRSAVGQLLDYKQSFTRKPSLGILLPERPSPSILNFLSSYKITAIWLTPNEKFRDSQNGKWSHLNRRD